MTSDHSPAPISDWVNIDTREATGALDCWQEYLCVARTADSFLLDVRAHKVLGAAPHDWFDDEGELLPEFVDGDGHPILPDEFEGQKVTGFDGENLIGGLATTHVGPVAAEATPASIRAALEDLNWEPSDFDNVLQALQVQPSAERAPSEVGTRMLRVVDSPLSAEDNYDVLDVTLTHILAVAGVEVVEGDLMALLIQYDRCLRIALGLSVEVAN